MFRRLNLLLAIALCLVLKAEEKKVVEYQVTRTEDEVRITFSSKLMESSSIEDFKLQKIFFLAWILGNPKNQEKINGVHFDQSLEQATIRFLVYRDQNGTVNEEIVKLHIKTVLSIVRRRFKVELQEKPPSQTKPTNPAPAQGEILAPLSLAN